MVDAMPREAIEYLAGIDDDTRVWLQTHSSRIARHKQWLTKTAADRHMLVQDGKIKMQQSFVGIDSGLAASPSKVWSEANIGIPQATLKLPPSLNDVRASIERRIRKK